MAKKPAKTEADAPAGEEGAKPKGKLAGLTSGKTPLIIGAVVAVLLVGGGAGFFLLKKGKGDVEVADTSAGKSSAAAPSSGGPKKPSAFLDLPEMTVNLAAGGGSQADRQYFLKMKIALEVNEQKVVTEIQPMLPRVLDTFQVYMRELRPQDLEGSAGLYRLKEEMMRRVNVAVYPAKVDAVLFKELMVQ
ncbi:MAG: flagellar basal body-associated FliL family protein [Beijerinckiaceae bacterium]